MIAFKCNFCDKWTSLFNVVKSEIDQISGKQLYAEVWNCEVCKVSFYLSDDGCYMTTFSVKIREQDYTLACLPKKNLALLSGGNVIIKSFDAVPDINPKNAHDKIKTYLTFL